MLDSINQQNLKADRLTYGKWAARDDQFSSEEPLRLLYDFFVSAQPELPDSLKVVEYGSAEGKVGEYFKKKLVKAGKVVHLTLVDVVKEHLEANKNVETEKIHCDLAEMNLKPLYDLGIGRSILHYFSEGVQKIVLKNIFNSLRTEGYYLSQNFVQLDSDLELYLKLNRAIGKSFSLVSVESLQQMFEEVGFKEVRLLGALPVWDYSSENLQQRYQLPNEEIQRFKEMIEETPTENRIGFKLTNTGFTIPIPYKVFLMRA
jgi:hypothetical protein